MPKDGFLMAHVMNLESFRVGYSLSLSPCCQCCAMVSFWINDQPAGVVLVNRMTFHQPCQVVMSRGTSHRMNFLIMFFSATPFFPGFVRAMATADEGLTFPKVPARIEDLSCPSIFRTIGLQSMVSDLCSNP